MTDLIRKLHSTLIRAARRPASLHAKSRGQSLVEIAIAFPMLIILFSGMIEFGFIINYYLSLLDGTREAARFYSNLDPFEDGEIIGNCQCPITLCSDEDPADTLDVDCDRQSFYSDTSAMVKENLEPHDADDTSRKILLDPARDDIIVTVISEDDGALTRFPAGFENFRQYGNQLSKFDDAAVSSLLVTDAPDTGILIVEVWYGYDQVLNLPWLDPFLPDPVMLHAYTIMPLIAAEPVNP